MTTAAVGAKNQVYMEVHVNATQLQLVPNELQ